MAEEILRLENITKIFPLGDGKTLTACDHINVSLKAGQSFGIVGESGSGKSTLVKILTRVYEATEGKIIFHGKDITHLSGEELRQHRRSIQMIFQDPSTAFNPRLRVRDIICEPLLNFNLIEKSAVDAKAREMLRLVDLPEDFAGRYPNNMSGGQRQRVAIARALTLEPEVILCDESTSALDVSVQKTIVDLLKKLQAEKHIAYLFICHDLSLANSFCDEILVMQHGKAVETIYDLREAKTEYSKKLLGSILTVEEGKNKILPDSLFED